LTVSQTYLEIVTGNVDSAQSTGIESKGEWLAEVGRTLVENRMVGVESADDSGMRAD
jgi:hypothetical protein